MHDACFTSGGARCCRCCTLHSLGIFHRLPCAPSRYNVFGLTCEPCAHDMSPFLLAEVLGSLKCDCSEQLQLAMHYIQDNQPGMVIYLQQEGRGIGLANKIAAYALQVSLLDQVPC